MENSLGRSFDRSVRAQLDPVWNQLGSTTKKLVADLRILRLLLKALCQYDCVTFLEMLGNPFIDNTLLFSQPTISCETCLFDKGL